MKKYIFSSLIFIFIAALIIAGIWLVVKPDKLTPELAFLKQEGFLDEEGNPFRSPGLFQQDINAPDESFQVLATKLNKNTGSYQLAFKLENKSNENKEFFLIPVSERDQLEFKEIKGVINNKNILSINKDDVKKDPLESLYDIKQHKKELNPELAQAYDDMEGNNYQGDPIKVTLGPNSSLVAKSGWEVKQDKKSEDLKPVYFLVYGSAGGAKEELTILTVHSHPAQGDDWPVEFTTVGMADLKIIPDDQDTIDDDEFTGLFCNGEERFPEILEGDVIYYPDWECLPRQSGAEAGDGIGKVVHYTKKAGDHTLRFEFGNQISYAYNTVPLVFHDGFETGSSAAWTSVTGSPTFVAGAANTGGYGMRANTSAATAYVTNSSGITSQMRLSFYLYITTAPSGADVPIVQHWNTIGASASSYIELTEDRYLKLYDQDDTYRGVSSTQLDTGQWYRIGLSIHNTNDDAKVYINGNEEISDTTGPHAVEAEVRLGVIESCNADLYFDDFASDGTESLDDLGDIRVLGARPVGQGADNDSGSDVDDWRDPAAGTASYDHIDSDPAETGDYLTSDGDAAIYRYSVTMDERGAGNLSTIGATDTIHAVNFMWYYTTEAGGADDYGVATFDQGTPVRDDNIDDGTRDVPMWLSQHHPDAPSDATAWDWTIFNTIEMGMANVSSGGKDLWWNDAYAMVAFTPDAGSASTISAVTDGPDTIEVGQTITFSVTWTDPDAPDGQHMYICKDDDGTSSGCGAGGTWCEDSDTYDTTSPLSCTYVIASGDVGVQDYYAFTCDAANNCSTTSASTQGTFTAKADDSISCPALTLDDLFNGTGQGFTGGSQANGGVDDYNDAGSAPSDRYEGSWTACTSGNNYCGTGLSSADAKDDNTNLIWSLPCNGSGCSSFSDTTPLTYTWDNSGANNNSQTASELCSAGSHGESGWFLPHQKQLMQAYIDGSYGNLEAAGIVRNYWSATTYSAGTTTAWSIDLSRGYIANAVKGGGYYVRCLRSAN